MQGRTRLKRDAQNGKKSWAARAAVNCAMFGAFAAETTLLWEVVVNRKLPSKEIAKNAAFACAAAVLTPALGNWIRRHGFNLEK